MIAVRRLNRVGRQARCDAVCDAAGFSFWCGGYPVTKEPDSPTDAMRRATIQRLVSEIGLSESEAIDLVRVLGTDWSSLVREARLLRSKR